MVNLNLPLTEEVINYAKLRSTFNKYNENCMNEFLNRYASYNNIDEVVGNCLDMGYEIIRKSIDEHVRVLLENHVYEVDSDVFFSQLFFKYSEWEKYFDLIHDKYMDIVLSEEEKDRYRTQRRLSREKIEVVGSNLVNIANLDINGCVGHALDSAKAMAVNTATNVAHGVFNLGSKAISSIGAFLNKKQLFVAPQTLETFREGIEQDLRLISEITLRILYNSESALLFKIPTLEEIQRAKSMLNNSEKIADVNTKTDVILKSIQIYPFDIDAYVKLAQIDLDYIFNLVQFSNTLCLNLTDVFHSFIGKLIIQSKNEKELLYYANIASKFNEYYHDEKFYDLQDMIVTKKEQVLQSLYENANKNNEQELVALKNEVLEKIKVLNINSRVVETIDKDMENLIEAQIQLELQRINEEVNSNPEEELIALKNKVLEKIKELNINSRVVETVDKAIQSKRIKAELDSVKTLGSKSEVEKRISELENKGFDREIVQQHIKGKFNEQTVLIRSVLKNIFNFNGRASRKEFGHAFFIFHIFAMLFCEFIEIFSPKFIDHGGSVIMLLFPFLLLLAVAIRRLHDAGLSGYIMISVFFLYPFLWIILLALPSKDDNEYGPKPKI